MCRNIRPLFNFEPPASQDELRDAALQYVRKISGMNAPSKVNRATFERAVDEVATATRRLVEGLDTSAPPRDREVERARARERWQKRAARAATAVALLLAPAAAAADWLVLTDGARVETRGSWEERGRLVVFTLPTGELTSLRAAEVDLDASRRATREATEEAARRRAEVERLRTAPPPERQPILVLGDGDVKSADPAVLAAIAEQAARPEIVVFKTSWCGYCKKAASLLRELGASFEERDIETSAAARLEFDRRFGRGTGVPVIDVGGQVLQGFSEKKLRRAVAELLPEEPLAARPTRPAASSPSAAPTQPPRPPSTPPGRRSPGRE